MKSKLILSIIVVATIMLSAFSSVPPTDVNTRPELVTIDQVVKGEALIPSVGDEMELMAIDGVTVEQVITVTEDIRNQFLANAVKFSSGMQRFDDCGGTILVRPDACYCCINAGGVVRCFTYQCAH